MAPTKENCSFSNEPLEVQLIPLELVFLWRSKTTYLKAAIIMHELLRKETAEAGTQNWYQSGRPGEKGQTLFGGESGLWGSGPQGPGHLRLYNPLYSPK